MHVVTLHAVWQILLRGLAKMVCFCVFFRGIFGLPSDNKINLAVRTNRLPVWAWD
ncbi:hypothetical protein TPHV1_150010 [Treponema phagedenis]|uniref:Uncharacterized protein n=1 Tax=Treponema phagedenis TaxID=162 RepID=A0A0B7GRR3_TREPH|nr:hypothetical protein TPHV1_150010 [Treponema phagedenis]